MSSLEQTAARKRIQGLLDACSFVELGAAMSARSTDYSLQEKKAPSDGVVTGYGTIEGELVYVYAQDPDTLGGSLGEVHAKKIQRLYETALKTGAPVIGLLDSTGIRLEEASDALSAFGSLYRTKSLASGVIPQISLVMGNCGGGMAVLAGLSDFVLMEEKAKLYVNSPNALQGNYQDKNDTSKAPWQAENASLVDLTAPEEELYKAARKLFTMLPLNNEDNHSYEECEDDLNRETPGLEALALKGDEALRLLADGGEVLELKPGYGRELVTALVRLNGSTTFVVACRETKEKQGCRLTPESMDKAARFVRFADAFSLPLLTLTSVQGYALGFEDEADMAKRAAALASAFANSTVPKVNLYLGTSTGTALLAMNGMGVGADLSFALTDSVVAVLDPEKAGELLAGDGEKSEEKAKKYREEKCSARALAERGEIDAVIEAPYARKRLISAFEMLFTKREEHPYRKHAANL